MWMRDTILIITSSFDKTADYLEKKYAEWKFFRFNTDNFNEYSISVSADEWLISRGDMSVSKNQVCSVYYRKPVLPVLTDYKQEYHLTIQRDIISVINGIADSFDRKVLTKPYILRKTENKIFQLLTAKSCGLVIPSSYIGNAENTIEFANKAFIIKPISTARIQKGEEWEAYYTECYTEPVEDISNTPVYLQQYIPKKYEVRLTIVDSNAFPVQIDCRDKTNWRRDYLNHKYCIIDCPDIVLKACQRLLNKYQLIFGAFDFIVTPDNEWVFLEVNPNGQWLWLEQALDLSISKSIINYLSC